MQDKTSPIFMAILALTAAFFLILSLYLLWSYFAEGRTSTISPENNEVSAQIPEIPIPIITATTSSVSSSQKPANVIRPGTTTGKDPGTAKGGNDGTQLSIQSAAYNQFPNFPLCTANDLTGSAMWQRADGPLVGFVKVRNSSNRGCSLSRDLALDVLSGNEILPTNQTGKDAAAGYTDLASGTEVPVWFVWSNWCGSDLSRPASVKLTLPGGEGYLKVPLIDQNGFAQQNTPRCDDSRALSMIRISL